MDRILSVCLPLSVCVFLSRGELKTGSVSLSDAVINTHTAVLRLSDDVILSAAVLLLSEREGKLGLGGDMLIYLFFIMVYEVLLTVT